MRWLFLSGAIAVEVSATLALRASDGFRRRGWIGPVAAGYVLAFVLLALALRAGLGVGVAYGTWAGVGIAATAVLARVIFDEPLTRTMGVGIALIAGGVFLVEIGTSGEL